MAEVGRAPEETISANGDDLLRYFRRRVAPEDAADLLADTMTTAWRRVRTMPTDPQAARMWLFKVAHNCLLNHLRGERRRRRLSHRLRETVAGLPAEPGADSGYEVRDAIARLDPPLAEIVRLVHWDGFTLQEVADLMELPASTVRNHHQRAKSRLRDALTAVVGEQLDA